MSDSKHYSWGSDKPLTDNLNKIDVVKADPSDYKRQMFQPTKEALVFFDDLERALIEQIELADIVIGCVAWLTNKKILRALSLKESVQIVVQKEDFLRPDVFELPDYKAELRTLYDALPCQMGTYTEMYELPTINGLSTSTCIEPDAIRCVGNYNRDKKPAFPRMHHKFVIFCRTRETVDSNLAIEPFAVWTGSFNFTYNASLSFENGLLLFNKDIVRAYLDEYKHIFALSEPLDWEVDWVAPEFRIGT